MSQASQSVYWAGAADTTAEQRVKTGNELQCQKQAKLGKGFLKGWVRQRWTGGWTRWGHSAQSPVKGETPHQHRTLFALEQQQSHERCLPITSKEEGCEEACNCELGQPSAQPMASHWQPTIRTKAALRINQPAEAQSQIMMLKKR